MIEIFETVGLKLTEANCIETIGMKINQVVEYWFEKNPWKNQSKENVTQQIIGRVNQLIENEADLRPCVDLAFEFFKEKQLPLAIASSSAISLIETTVKTLGISHFFDSVHSAEFEEHGKPHPAVYLTAAKALGKSPDACLAFEDSLNGIRAAKNAGMICVAVKESATDFEAAKKIADFAIEGFEDFSNAKFLEELDFCSLS